MPPSAETARKAILGATEQLLRGHGAGSITVDAVAQAAGCAKGLVHYHFGTKTELLREALLTMTGARETKWIAAMNALILEESQNGTLRALASFAVTGDPVIDRAVRDSVRQFGARLTDTVASMLDRADLTPAIPADQIGWMIAAVVQGTCQHLIVGAERETLENAYATAWLGVLSLTRPSG
jgi:AcrR family transcriptional regulator